MKYFHSTNRFLDGAFHYVYQRNKLNIDSNAVPESNSDPLIFLIQNPSTAVVHLQAQSQVDSYVDVRLTGFRVFPTSYQLQHFKGGSPPCAWELYGYSESTKQWVLIDTQTNQLDVCPHDEGNSVCSVNSTSFWRIKKPIGPFTAIRFLQTNNRYIVVFGRQSKHLRLGGIEVYGSLFTSSESLFQNTCYRKQLSSSIYLMIYIVFIS